MDGEAPSTDRLVALVTDGTTEAAVAHLEGFRDAPPEARKRAVRSLRSTADADPDSFDGLVAALSPFLVDDERAVRLSTAKLLVAVAESNPGAVRAVVPDVADRLADDEEFYYVRARCAETLGYVALEDPDAVHSPEVLADLRIGLAFDEPEVREKLAKALECVALGDPRRLRHQVSSLADHLGDDEVLVRYHLCTALVAVGATHPERLTAAADSLRERLDDPDPYVRGRAAEALALLARGADVSVPADTVADLADSDAEFLARRARALDRALGAGAAPPDGVDDHRRDDPDGFELGSLDAVRATSETAVADLTTPDADGECPHCGLALPEQGPPVCPKCGAPR